jgi:excisionase family DNA binding protein
MVEQQLNEILERVTGIERLLGQPRVEQEYLSIRVAEVYTGLSDDHIRRAVTGGTLPCSNVGTPGRALYRMRRSNLHAWMRERESGPKPPARRQKTERPSGQKVAARMEKILDYKQVMQ